MCNSVAEGLNNLILGLNYVRLRGQLLGSWTPKCDQGTPKQQSTQKRAKCQKTKQRNNGTMGKAQVWCIVGVELDSMSIKPRNPLISIY
jgi:hypothetical protein